MIEYRHDVPVAQRIEHLPTEQRAGGSNLSRHTVYKPQHDELLQAHFCFPDWKLHFMHNFCNLCNSSAEMTSGVPAYARRIDIL